MSFDNSWNEKIYSKGKALNRYPYGELISVFFHSLKYLETDKNRKDMKVLEIGCGSGNNLWFIRELGFEVFGIDGSEIALKSAEELFKQRGLVGHFQKAYFQSLPFEDNSFDILIDRGGTVCNTEESLRESWASASRVLKPGGLFIAFMLNEHHPSYSYAKSHPERVKFISEKTLTNMSCGDLVDVGTITFVNLEDIMKLFKFGEIKEIQEHRSNFIYPKEKAKANGYSEYIIIGVKNGN